MSWIARGRRGIFADKKTHRLQGVITSSGARLFEAARKRLAKAAGVDRASDADTIEYLAHVEKMAANMREIVLEDVKDRNK